MKQNIGKGKWMKGILIFVLILLAFIIYYTNQNLFHTIFQADLDALSSMLKNRISYAYFFMLIVMIIQNMFTIIPLLLVITVNVILFGFLKGFLWSWISSIIAATLVYFIVRYFFHDTLVKKIKPEMIQNVQQKGFSYVFQGRIFPLIPTSIVNILAGVSSVSFPSFFFGTTLGNFLYFFVLALLPAGVLSETVNEYVVGLIFLLAFVLYYSFKKKTKKKKRRQTDSSKMDV